MADDRVVINDINDEKQLHQMVRCCVINVSIAFTLMFMFSRFPAIYPVKQFHIEVECHLNNASAVYAFFNESDVERSLHSDYHAATLRPYTDSRHVTAPLKLSYYCCYTEYYRKMHRGTCASCFRLQIYVVFKKCGKTTHLSRACWQPACCKQDGGNVLSRKNRASFGVIFYQ